MDQRRRLARAVSILSESEMSIVREDPIFAYVGNAAHLVSLSGLLGFTYALFRSVTDQEQERISTFSHLFDEQWKNYGFCVAVSEDPPWNTHDLCSYLDLVTGILFGLMLFCARKTRGMQRANSLLASIILGIFAHGVGHLLLGRAMRDGLLDLNGMSGKRTHHILNAKTVDENFALQLPSLFFWCGLLQSVISKTTTTEGQATTTQTAIPTDKMQNWARNAVPTVTSKTALGLLAVVVHSGQLFIPLQFGFVYVQILVVSLFSCRQLTLSSPEKDFVYAVFPMTVLVPQTLLLWLESTQCTDFVKAKFLGHLMGHVCEVYLIFAWYALCYMHIAGSASMAKTIKKVKFV